MSNESAQVHGVVKWFNQDKGYGFITRGDGEKDVFVHITDVRRSRIDVDLFDEGDKVIFDIDESGKGPKAVNISIE